MRMYFMTLEKRIDLSRFLHSEEFFRYRFPEIALDKPRGFIDTQNQPGIDSSDYLVMFSEQPRSYCVGCVDMVNSTKISASISSQKLPTYYETFLNSMSKIIGKFGGRVIKNVGDCLLYYFPNSVDTGMDGLLECLNCGLAMIEAQTIICQQLTTQKLPCLSYRVSADCGNVLLMSTTDSATLDFIGPSVNMCAKINLYADNNEFVIGGDLYELIKKIPRYRFEQKLSCNVGFKQSYPVYKVRQH